MPIDELKVEGYEDDAHQLYVVYVKKLGTDIDGNSIYRFYLSENPDDVFADGWGEVPACNVRREYMDISEEHCQAVLEARTGLELDLAQDCCCFSMQDSRDGIVALAWENLDNADEYPEPRIILHFADPVEDIEKVFGKRDIALKYVE